MNNMLRYCQIYYNQNKEKCISNSKQYKEQRNKTPINCGCGMTIKYTSLTQHVKTIQHRNFLKEL